MNFINGRPEDWEYHENNLSKYNDEECLYNDGYEAGADAMKEWFIKWLESKTSMTKGKDRYIIITGEEWEQLNQ